MSKDKLYTPGISKVDLLIEFFAYAQRHNRSNSKQVKYLKEDTAKRIVKESTTRGILYIKSVGNTNPVVLNIRWQNGYLDPRGYDLVYGAGSAKQIVDSLIEETKIKRLGIF